jgi:3-oxoacyl-[acyl-carrier protein] reductase
MNLGLHGKVALVTAASKGLGRAIALALAAEGALVMIAARHQESLLQTAQEIEEITRSTVLTCPADVGKREDLEALVSNTLKAYKGIDIIVHNTGGPPVGTFESVSEEQWQTTFETELLSAVRLIRLVLPSMRQRGGGCIIHIVSTSVKQPSEGLILANAIRPGVVGLAKPLAIDLAPEHITVNNVCPGRILTDRLRYGGVSGRECHKGCLKKKLCRRWSRPFRWGGPVGPKRSVR